MVMLGRVRGHTLRIMLPVVLACLLGAPAVVAQVQPPAAAHVAPSIEVVNRDVDLEAASDGRFWMTEEIAYRPLNSQGVQALQQFTLSYTAGFEDQRIAAYTLKKDGRRIDIPQNSILQGHGETTSPGFEDTRTQTVVFPSLEVGDQAVMTIIKRQLVPWFPNVFAVGFSFSRAIVIREATIAFTTQDKDAAFHIAAAGLEPNRRVC